jgi:insertion element IS1 protein InsB
VASTEDHIVSDEERTVVEHLLRERISLCGSCWAVGVSLTWLLHFMVERFASCPDHLHVQLPVNPTDVVIRRLEAETDEMWCFVGKKANKQWIWLAMDAKTRQAITFHMHSSNWPPCCVVAASGGHRRTLERTSGPETRGAGGRQIGA